MDKILLNPMFSPIQETPNILDQASTNATLASAQHMNPRTLRRQIDIPKLRTDGGIPSFLSMGSRQQIGRRDMGVTFEDEAANEAASLISNPLLDRLDEKQRRETKIMLHTFFAKGASMYKAFLTRGLTQNVTWFKGNAALCEAFLRHAQNKSSSYVTSLFDLHGILEKEGRLNDKEMIERLFFNLIYLFEEKAVR